MKAILALAAAAVVTSAVSADVLWDQWTTQYGNLLAAQDDPVSGLDPQEADDFYFDVASTILDIHWVGGYWNGYAGATFDWRVEIWPDAGGMPGAFANGPLWSESYSAAEVNETYVYDNGSSYFFEYSVDVHDPFLANAGETYWLSVIGVGAFPPQSGWSTSENGNGQQVYFKSTYFGYPDWVAGNVVFGVEYETAFRLTGVPTPGALALLGLAGLVSRRRR